MGLISMNISKQCSALYGRTLVLIAICFSLKDHNSCFVSAGFAVSSSRVQNKYQSSFSKNNKKRTALSGSKACRISEECDDIENDVCGTDRRRFLLSSLFLTSALTSESEKAHAKWIQFPCTQDLNNNYYLMRAGQSLLEEQDIWETNPMFSTNREAALSPLGIEQVRQTCEELIARDFNPTFVKYSLAAASIDTADIIANELRIGRNRVVPEYTYLDPRGIGLWNQFGLSSTQAAVWAMDVEEAGERGLGGIPPAHNDGTAHETLSDQVTRLRQLISLLETQNSGDNILLIFPDGTGPALLTCMIGGLPLNRVHEIEFKPGEIRYDITMESAQQQFLSNEPPSSYYDLLERGKAQLAYLRENPELDLGRRLNIHQEAAASKLAKVQKAPEPKAEDVDKPPPRKLDSETKNGFGVFAAASFGVMGALGGGSGKDDVEKLKDDKLTLTNNETATTESISYSSSSSNSTVESLSDLKSDPELLTLEENIEKAPIDLPELSLPILEDLSASASKEDNNHLIEDRTLDALNAMEEYMNQDDGSEAWFGVMAELMQEDE